MHVYIDVHIHSSHLSQVVGLNNNTDITHRKKSIKIKKRLRVNFEEKRTIINDCCEQSAVDDRRVEIVPRNLSA
jgi:hypothetical protein